MIVDLAAPVEMSSPVPSETFHAVRLRHMGDGRYHALMYFTVSYARTIYAFDVDTQMGTVLHNIVDPPVSIIAGDSFQLAINITEETRTAGDYADVIVREINEPPHVMPRIRTAEEIAHHDRFIQRIIDVGGT
jgi:hypothetical protein